MTIPVDFLRIYALLAVRILDQPISKLFDIALASHAARL
jgi:hypothetical protein